MRRRVGGLTARARGQGHAVAPPCYGACMRQYLDLLDHVLTTGVAPSTTAPARAR